MSVTAPGTQLKCKVCGDSEFIRQGNREVCKYCGATYAVSDPAMDSELHTAESFREGAQFEVAAGLYRKIVRTYRDYDLSDAYWGLFLCEQRVLFETDAKGERFPSFFSIVPEHAQNSDSFLKAVEAAEQGDAEKAEVFRNLCKKICDAKELYRKIGAGARPFDIFICFKKSITNGEGYTKDWKTAYDLYDRLSGTYNVFFSEKSLDNLVMHQYEPNIYYGLYTAKVMLLLCSKREYLDSQWVKNEWSRFYAFGQNPATGKTIIPIFIDDFTPEQLPAELQSYQGYPADYNLIDHLNKNLQTILKPVDHEAETKNIEAKLAEQQAAFDEKLNALLREMEKKKEEPKQQSSNPSGANFSSPYSSNVSGTSFSDPAAQAPRSAYTPRKPEPTLFYDDVMIKEEIKQEKKYKQMLAAGIICLFLCFWVGAGLLIARWYMINKATANKVNEYIAAGGVYRAAAKPDGSPSAAPVKKRKYRLGWMISAVFWGVIAFISLVNASSTKTFLALAASSFIIAVMSAIFSFSPKKNPYILNGAVGIKKAKFFSFCNIAAMLVLVLLLIFFD